MLQQWAAVHRLSCRNTGRGLKVLLRMRWYCAAAAMGVQAPGPNAAAAALCALCYSRICLLLRMMPEAASRDGSRPQVRWRSLDLRPSLGWRGSWVCWLHPTVAAPHAFARTFIQA